MENDTKQIDVSNFVYIILMISAFAIGITL